MVPPDSFFSLEDFSTLPGGLSLLLHPLQSSFFYKINKYFSGLLELASLILVYLVIKNFLRQGLTM
jgi:hypothetical protein